MTVRTIGRMDDRARWPLVAVVAVLAVPVAAQETPTPAPSTFRLPPASDGRTPGVQGPSDGVLPPLAPGERGGQPAPTPTPTPTPTPAPTPAPTAPPPVVTTRPAPAPATAAPAPTTRRAGPAAALPNTAGATPAAAAAAPETAAPVAAAPESGTVASPAPGFSADPTIPAPAAPSPQGAAVTAPVGGSGGTPIWAWLLAGLAAVGAGVWYWRRRPLIAGELPVDLDEPIARPQPEPQPRAADPAARPAPAAPPAPATPRASAAPLVTRPPAERRARVAMALDIRGIRMTSDQLIVALTLNLVNEGAVAATGLMVRVALNQGSAMPEPVLARFYDGAGGSVLRDDIQLAAGAGDRIATEVMLPRAAIEPLTIGGKPMLIPVLAFDVTYHWDGDGDAFGQCAGSFVLGREQGTSGSEKLAPLPLDRPNLIVNRPGARTTAIRRDQ